MMSVDTIYLLTSSELRACGLALMLERVETVAGDPNRSDVDRLEALEFAAVLRANIVAEILRGETERVAS